MHSHFGTRSSAVTEIPRNASILEIRIRGYSSSLEIVLVSRIDINFVECCNIPQNLLQGYHITSAISLAEVTMKMLTILHSHQT